MTGRRFVARPPPIGKTLFLDTSDDGPVLKLGFGMSGRLVVDGVAGVDDLVYASERNRSGRGIASRCASPTAAICACATPAGSAGRARPRRGSASGRSRGLTLAGLRAALGNSTAPLKARLMDQARIAGVGNLIADELLWRAGLDPARPAGSLHAARARRLHRHLVATLDRTARGGSHTGDLMPERHAGGVCPKDGTPLVRRTIGGRTTWSCPTHQV